MSHMRALGIALILFAVSRIPASAESIVDTTPHDQIQPTKLDGTWIAADSRTFDVLHCVRRTAPQDLYFTPKTCRQQNDKLNSTDDFPLKNDECHRRREAQDLAIKDLSSPLDTSFIRHGMNDIEQAMFLSQALVESNFLTNMTETKNFGADPDQINQIIAAYSETGEGLKTQKVAGNHIGRGLLQISRFDNRISTLDYMAQRFDIQANKAPVWKGEWTFPLVKRDKKTDKLVEVEYQLKADESDPEVIRQFTLWYKKKYPTRDLNVMGLMDHPERWGVTELPFEYERNGLKSKMNSSSMVTEIAMAYWHGKCRGEMKKLAADPIYKSKIFGPSNYDGRKDYLVNAATKCVKGVYTKDDILKRGQWYELIRECQKLKPSS